MVFIEFKVENSVYYFEMESAQQQKNNPLWKDIKRQQQQSMPMYAQLVTCAYSTTYKLNKCSCRVNHVCRIEHIQLTS